MKQRYLYPFLLIVAVVSLLAVGIWSMYAGDAAEHRVCGRAANSTAFNMATLQYCEVSK